MSDERREMGAGKPIEWIRCDESGREMVSRVLSGRPFIVPVPPLHRVPLRLGNIVEISGPSNSAKSQVLLQVCSVRWHLVKKNSMMFQSDYVISYLLVLSGCCAFYLAEGVGRNPIWRTREENGVL